VYETQVTVVGNVVTPIGRRRFNDGTVVANFRVGTSERRYDRAAGTWVDGDRLYVEVSCRRHLAENAIASLVKGDPVVVTGRLFTRNYEHDGQRRSTVTLEAHSIAADLSRCTVVLTRTRRGGAGEGSGAGDDRNTGAGGDGPAAADLPGAGQGDEERNGTAPQLVGALTAAEG
jgi:single-strand DNA-binding protein